LSVGFTLLPSDGGVGVVLLIVVTVGSSSVGHLREVPHTGDTVHLTRVLAVGLGPVALPGPVVQPFEHPAPLHGGAHHDRRALDDGRGLPGGDAPLVDVVAEAGNPTSVPGQGVGGRALDLDPAERAGGVEHGVAGAHHRLIGA
jgi:hypothetical protein